MSDIKKLLGEFATSQEAAKADRAPKQELELAAIYKAMASSDPAVREEATQLMGNQLADNIAQGFKAQAETERATAEPNPMPLRPGVFDGANNEGIWTQVSADNGVSSYEYQLDFVAPGTEKDYVAYTIPNTGYIPERRVVGDELLIPIYHIANGIDASLRYAQNADWDVLRRMQEALAGGFTKKNNDDSWNTVIAAGYDRNLVVTDSDAAQGQFTKRLISLAKVAMRRNGGGNSTSLGRTELTDIYTSPEAMEGVRNWNVDQISDITRTQFFANERSIQNIYEVNLVTLDELGVGQEYQLYWTNILGATMPTGKVEIAVGLDRRNRNKFIRPVPKNGQIQLFADPALHRRQLFGWYGWMSGGWACVDNRGVVIMAI